MKNNLKLFLLLLLFAQISTAELHQLILPPDPGNYSTRESTEELTIPVGSYVELVSAVVDSYPTSSHFLKVTVAGNEYLYPVAVSNGADSRVAKFALLGPATIKLQSQISMIALFRVTDQASATGSIIVPEDDPTATFEVFMEASTDMETWVRVIPGDYDASGGAKFFRVRMVKK